MLTTSRRRLFCFLLNSAVVLLTLQVSSGQQTDPRPSVDLNQDVLKIPIEEVRVPVFASDEGGRLDTQLSIGDLLIREDGIAQNLRGVYRVPAYVLLLADTGG